MKYGPYLGDVGVIGYVDYIYRWPLGSCAFFFAAVTANGYASIAQNLGGAQMRFQCSPIPDGLKPGDAVTVDITGEENGVIYAENMQAL